MKLYYSTSKNVTRSSKGPHTFFYALLSGTKKTGQKSFLRVAKWYEKTGQKSFLRVVKWYEKTGQKSFLIH